MTSQTSKLPTPDPPVRKGVRMTGFIKGTRVCMSPAGVAMLHLRDPSRHGVVASGRACANGIIDSRTGSVKNV